MRRLALALLLLAMRATPLLGQNARGTPAHGPLRADDLVRGWTILSDREADDLAVIAAARRYEIDHLELSHDVVMDLNEVRDDRKRGLVNRLTDSAHAAGIREVVVWDHALYELAYYPARFRTGPNGTIDLDDPAFWAWLKQDYRELLDRVPNVDGVVLTFIETGARAERHRVDGRAGDPRRRDRVRAGDLVGEARRGRVIAAECLVASCAAGSRMSR